MFLEVTSNLEGAFHLPNNSLKPWQTTPAYCAGSAAGSRLGPPGRIPPGSRDPG
jgi:hypothetical protein